MARSERQFVNADATMTRWKIPHSGDNYGRVASALASDLAFRNFHAYSRPLQGSSLLVHLQKGWLFAVAFATLCHSARRLGSQLRARIRRLESGTVAASLLASAVALSSAAGD